MSAGVSGTRCHSAARGEVRRAQLDPQRAGDAEQVALGARQQRRRCVSACGPRVRVVPADAHELDALRGRLDELSRHPREQRRHRAPPERRGVGRAVQRAPHRHRAHERRALRSPRSPGWTTPTLTSGVEACGAEVRRRCRRGGDRCRPSSRRRSRTASSRGARRDMASRASASVRAHRRLQRERRARARRSDQPRPKARRRTPTRRRPSARRSTRPRAASAWRSVTSAGAST